MRNNSEGDIKYIPYKEFVKKRALDYYYANKEIISQKNKNKYKSLSPEQKKKRRENTKQLFNVHLVTVRLLAAASTTPEFSEN